MPKRDPTILHSMSYAPNELPWAQRVARVELSFYPAHEGQALARVSPHVELGAHFRRGAPDHQVGGAGLGFLSQFSEQGHRASGSRLAPAQQRVAVAHVRPDR